MNTRGLNINLKPKAAPVNGCEWAGAGVGVQGCSLVTCVSRRTRSLMHFVDLSGAVGGTGMQGCPLVTYVCRRTRSLMHLVDLSGAVGGTGVGSGLIERVGGKSWVLDYTISQSTKVDKICTQHNATQGRGRSGVTCSWPRRPVSGETHQMLSTHTHTHTYEAVIWSYWVTSHVTCVDGRSVPT